MSASSWRAPWWFYLAMLGLVLIAVLLSGWLLYELVPGVRFRVQSLWTEVYDRVSPHSETVPTPAQSAHLETPAWATLTATLTPTVAATAIYTATLTPTATPPPPTALPVKFSLTHVRHEYQKFNNCGPASLSMVLNYWGWPGSQVDAAAYLKPNQDDKNVSPREMYEYLLTQNYDAYIRMDGDLETLKLFLAAGYPPLIERGFEVTDKGWMGHYNFITGYDDARGVFIVQDSYLGPDHEIQYVELERLWRAFNFIYLIVFPAGVEHDAQVRALLGPAGDLTANYQAALQRAQREAYELTGQDAAFAWFNVGTSLAYLQDYAGAASAYDQARQQGLPYRMLWYQFQPYRAYYYMARYQDVMDLANFVIASTPLPSLEEPYYWRGQAEEMLGQRNQAVADYRQALGYNPHMQLAQAALRALGETP